MEMYLNSLLGMHTCVLTKQLISYDDWSVFKPYQ